MIAPRSVEGPYRLILLALLIFPIHVAEETAGGFVSWMNSLVDRPINVPLFLTVNAVCMAITTLLCLASALTRSRDWLSVSLGWLAFLMFANGIFHLVGTVMFDRYSPGTVTACLLYIPFFVSLLAVSIRSGEFKLLPFSATALIAGVPGCIHFYRILFEGRRLL